MGNNDLYAPTFKDKKEIDLTAKSEATHDFFFCIKELVHGLNQPVTTL